VVTLRPWRPHTPLFSLNKRGGLTTTASLLQSTTGRAWRIHEHFAERPAAAAFGAKWELLADVASARAPGLGAVVPVYSKKVGQGWSDSQLLFPLWTLLGVVRRLPFPWLFTWLQGPPSCWPWG